MPKASKTVEKPDLGILITGRSKKPAVFREVYPIQEPYVYAAIVKDPKTHTYTSHISQNTK